MGIMSSSRFGVITTQDGCRVWRVRAGRIAEVGVEDGQIETNGGVEADIGGHAGVGNAGNESG